MKTDRFLNEELQNINDQLKKHLIKGSAGPLFFEFEEINLSELLNHVICEKIFFFKSKYEDFTFLGLGLSKIIKAQNLKDHLENNPKQILSAAFLFEADPHSSEFILPEWIFVLRNGKTQLTINSSYEYNNFSSPKLFFNLGFELDHYDPHISPWSAYEENPEHDQWAKMIEKCDQLFNAKELEKIVLSRKKIFSYNGPVGPVAFFKAVLKENNNANTSYAIFHQMAFDKAFISLTPEKLFSMQGLQFESIALAASAPRGKTPEEDEAFEAMLKSNERLTREHNLVIKEIIQRITPIVVSLKVSDRETMKLPYIQHLSIPISATMPENISAIDLVRILHPTPAIGGLPWDKAKVKILELEPYSRKSYAAPIGVIGKNYSELAVGIRSALIEGSKITVFGGAGIVKGSDAEEEWIETGIKMNPFLKVLNHE